MNQFWNFEQKNNMKAYKKYFHNALKTHFPQAFSQMIAELETHYQHISLDSSFAATSSNPIDRRLDFSAYFLALIQTLDEQGEPFERIRTICLEVVIDYVKPKNQLQTLLKKMPVRLMNTWFGQYLIKSLQRKAGKLGHPDGFLANIITDKAETYGLGYGVDILECGICKLFKKHNYQQYSSILCEVDEVTSNLAGLQMIRSGTIANGAKKCDFRYKRME